MTRIRKHSGMNPSIFFCIILLVLFFLRGVFLDTWESWETSVAIDSWFFCFLSPACVHSKGQTVYIPSGLPLLETFHIEFKQYLSPSLLPHEERECSSVVVNSCMVLQWCMPHTPGLPNACAPNLFQHSDVQFPVVNSSSFSRKQKRNAIAGFYVCF